MSSTCWESATWRAPATLPARCIQAGLRVTLVLGGPPVAGFPAPGLDTVALPPLRSGPGGFSQLVDLAGRPVSEAYLAERRDRLLSAFEAIRPDIVVIEAFPFGRRQMRFELEPLLERAGRASWGPLVACSVRDIVQEGRKAGRDRETVEVLKRHFDLVLVHGDPALVTLDATFPLAEEIAPLVRYTGIVAGRAGALQGEGADVVVSAGGGAAGAHLMRAACGALPRSGSRMPVGPSSPAPICLPRWLTRFPPNFPQTPPWPPTAKISAALLANAELSISQAGYNTAADVLKAGCRSIMVPFAAGGETEQSRRAEALSALGSSMW
jgi:predicted glycosyltransferase